MRLLSALVAWSLGNRAVVLVATALFVAFGLRAATSLPVDAVPDITNVQVAVITAAPALSPVEVEQIVTVPVERAMAGVPHTRQVRSISKFGLSVVTVIFDDDTNIYFARQLVSERLHEAQEAIPPKYGKPEMGPITSGLGEIYEFTVENDRMTQMQIGELYEWVIAPQLRTVHGVVDVNTFGGQDRQYQVVLDPARLQAAGVSVTQVVEAVEKANGNAGGGYIERNREHLVVGTLGMVRSLDDLDRVVVGTSPRGAPISIAAIGEAQLGPRLRRGAATKDGEREALVGVALMLMGENSRTVTEAVKAKLAAIAPSLPEGTRIEPFYDRSELVDRTMKTVGTNLVAGAALVITVLLVLLGDLRAGLVVAVTIPLALLFAIIVMNAAALTGNLMSLGAIDFGLLVDGAVIIVENAARRLSEERARLGRELTGEERTGVVRDATLEVRSASIFGEAIIAIVYLPILTLGAIEGKLFRPMATTVLLALVGAFVLSLTLVPVLTSIVVRPRAGHSETWLLRRLQAAYTPALSRAVRHRAWTVGLGFLALAGALSLFSRIGAEFVPQLDEGSLLIEARRAPGVALSESIASDLRLERAIRKVPEVDHVVSRIGAPRVATDPMGMEQSDVYIQLGDRSSWRRGMTKEKLAVEIRAIIDREVPDIAGAVSQPIQMRTNELLAGTRSDVAVMLYGPDLDDLAKYGDKIADVVRGIPGAVDVRVEQVAGLQSLRIVPDRAKLQRYGITVDEINRLAQTLSVGLEAGEVLEGERRFEIVVKTATAVQDDLEPIRDLPLRAATGQIVPLGDVAAVEITSAPAEISRDSQSRRLAVEFNARGRDLLSVVRDAQSVVAARVALPPGYRAEWGGQFEHYIDARARLSIVVPLALAFILFLLWLAFGKARPALLIFLNVPFAMSGGVVALWARGIPFSISAGVGFVALFGVAVLNGLVLVSFARHLEEGGMEPGTAIERAAALRLRPVLMTALVASLGYIPMALSTDPGAEVQRPLATVIIGGLVTSTLLTMFVLPALYAWLGARPSRHAFAERFARMGRRIRAWRSGEHVQPES